MCWLLLVIEVCSRQALVPVTRAHMCIFTVIDWQPLNHHEFNKLSVRMSDLTEPFDHTHAAPRVLFGLLDLGGTS